MFGCFCHCSAKIAPKSLILNDCSNVRAFLHRVWVKRRCVGRVGLPMHEIKTPKIFNLLSIYSNNNKYIQHFNHFFLCFRPLACSQICSTSPYAKTKHQMPTKLLFSHQLTQHTTICYSITTLRFSARRGLLMPASTHVRGVP